MKHSSYKKKQKEIKTFEFIELMNRQVYIFFNYEVKNFNYLKKRINELLICSSHQPHTVKEFWGELKSLKNGHLEEVRNGNHPEKIIALSLMSNATTQAGPERMQATEKNMSSLASSFGSRPRPLQEHIFLGIFPYFTRLRGFLFESVEYDLPSDITFCYDRYQLSLGSQIYKNID